MKSASQSLLFLVKFGCSFYVLQKYGVEASVCVGPSMEPTLNAQGDIVIFEHISPRWGTLQPGDVVVAKSPSNPHSYICKRVKVVGDKPFSSRFWKYRQRTPQYVPRGYIWLQGDNADNSTDSREYGPVPEALIVGRVFLRIWPMSQIEWIGRSPKISTN
ncbi:hypothetical protein GpartN1_g1396.t1 [Galdieria partita]|uniref:Peptidase S26 domain-containing protein n=1 Tax=Galdieria partita TaxID=83374 RepID=A0A9C7PSA7_9RHOD|nr:hypothetical protein GpartN1_g1396.t1 [Galdieria partita]